MAIVTDRPDTAVSYSSDATEQEVGSRRSCFTRVAIQASRIQAGRCRPYPHAQVGPPCV